MSQVEKSLTPLKAIREKCIECSGGNRAEVANCEQSDCSLYFYRKGTNPRRRRVGTVKNIAPSSSAVAGGYQHTTPSEIVDETPTQQATGDQGGPLANVS